MQRRAFLILAGVAIPLAAAAATDPPRLKVSRSDNCECCGAWAEHMRGAGFDVDVAELDHGALSALKTRLGIGSGIAACHTGQIEGYFVEGHVPAEDVKRLIAERRDVAGLAVPGMPLGSPGMETGDRREPFDTLVVDRAGLASVFAEHR